MRDGVSRQYGMDLGGVLVVQSAGVPIDGYIAPGSGRFSTSVPLWVWEECRVLAGVRWRSWWVFSDPAAAGVYAELRRLHGRRAVPAGDDAGACRRSGGDAAIAGAGDGGVGACGGPAEVSCRRGIAFAWRGGRRR